MRIFKSDLALQVFGRSIFHLSRSKCGTASKWRKKMKNSNYTCTSLFNMSSSKNIQKRSICLYNLYYQKKYCKINNDYAETLEASAVRIFNEKGRPFSFKNSQKWTKCLYDLYCQLKIQICKIILPLMLRFLFIILTKIDTFSWWAEEPLIFQGIYIFCSVFL